jgi:lauroyl/myristoyl acyltransferase
MRFVLKAPAVLPTAVLYRLGDAAFFIGDRILRWRHDVARANLARPFPEKIDAQGGAVLCQSYRNLGDLIAEII